MTALAFSRKIVTPMQEARIFPIVLVIVLVLFQQPVFGLQRSVDRRGQGGHTYLLDDTPPHAWIGGGYTHYRALEPNALHFFDPSLPEFKWRKEKDIQSHRRAGWPVVHEQALLGWLRILRIGLEAMQAFNELHLGYAF